MAKLNLISFFKDFPDEKSAVEYFEKQRWPKGVICPYCGSERISSCSEPMPYRCKDCRKHFSVKIGTVLNESKLPLLKWLLAIYILTNAKKGISSVQLSEYLGVTQKTAWFLAHRIRETWLQKSTKLSGIVEVDETFIGGKEKNKHESKKLKSGRGATGKQPVIGLKQRGKDIKGFIVAGTDADILTTVIRENIKAGSTVYTDEWKAYIGLDEFKHKSVNHSVGEFVRNNIHTNSIESFWAILKRGYYGIYHKWSFNHLHRYVNEFSARHNLCGKSERFKINYTIKKSIDKSLHYKELINA